MRHPSPEYLRRKCNKSLYLQIKEAQKTKNRFEVSVMFEISLVTVRFAFAAFSYREFKLRERMGLKNLGKSHFDCFTEAQKVNDPHYEEDSIDFNMRISETA